MSFEFLRQINECKKVKSQEQWPSTEWTLFKHELLILLGIGNFSALCVFLMFKVMASQNYKSNIMGKI